MLALLLSLRGTGPSHQFISGWSLPRRRALYPRPGPLRRIGHALAAEAVAESVRGHGIGEAEPHVELLRLVAASLARSLQASLALKCVELSELTAKAAGR
jgi:hypothetical protein